jgi:hypothetical protein
VKDEDDGNDSENVSEQEQEMPNSTEKSLEGQETHTNMSEEEEAHI